MKLWPVLNDPFIPGADIAEGHARDAARFSRWRLMVSRGGKKGEDNDYWLETRVEEIAERL